VELSDIFYVSFGFAIHDKWEKLKNGMMTLSISEPFTWLNFVLGIGGSLCGLWLCPNPHPEYQ